jgi:YD repeat-containing protein
VTVVDGPRTDVSDITTTVYNASRLPTQITGPAAPEASVTRIDYDDDDKVRATASKVGTQWLVSCTLWSKSGQETAAFGPKLVASDTDCSFGSDAAVARENTSYDAADRAVFTSAPNGADARTVRSNLLPDGPVASVVEAEGTPVARTTGSWSYSDNGLPLTLTDARGNRTAYEYDGFDRLFRIRHPSLTDGAVPSATDYAEYLYDKAGNIVSERRRDGQLLQFAYDNVGSLKLKDVPEADRDVSYAYDLMGRLTSATLPAPNAPLSVSYSYDRIGRVLSAVSGQSLTYSHEPAGAWSAMTYPGGLAVTTCYDAAGRVARIKEAANCTNDSGLLARYAYDAASRRTQVVLGNGTTTTFAYDPQSRLASLSHDLAGTASDVAWNQSYNRVGQVTSGSRSNDSYAWTGHYNVTRTYTTNTLDQYTTTTGRGLGWDGRGNLARSGPNAYAHDSENRLITARGVALTHDALGRLVRMGNATGPHALYDGNDLVVEFDAAGAPLRRHVHGPGVQEPIVTYEAGTKNWLYADLQGSIVAKADTSGVATDLQGYGPFGEPDPVWQHAQSLFKSP